MSGAAAASGRSTVREYYEAILIAVVFALFVRTFVVQAFKIPTGSMEDNLLVGDHILVDKVAYAPHLGRPWDVVLPYREIAAGDVVVFKWPVNPLRDFIKRCLAVPGNVIEIRNKTVYIDGEARTEDPPVFFKGDEGASPGRQRLPERDDFGPMTIPAGGYFMMGDNRDRSYDSRFWGPVPRDNVKGRALLIYWSFDSPPQKQDHLTLGQKIRQLGDVVRHFFTKTRWKRSLTLIR